MHQLAARMSTKVKDNQLFLPTLNTVSWSLTMSALPSASEPSQRWPHGSWWAAMVLLQSVAAQNNDSATCLELLSASGVWSLSFPHAWSPSVPICLEFLSASCMECLSTYMFGVSQCLMYGVPQCLMYGATRCCVYGVLQCEDMARTDHCLLPIAYILLRSEYKGSEGTLALMGWYQTCDFTCIMKSFMYILLSCFFTTLPALVCLFPNPVCVCVCVCVCVFNREAYHCFYTQKYNLTIKICLPKWQGNWTLHNASVLPEKNGNVSTSIKKKGVGVGVCRRKKKKTFPAACRQRSTLWASLSGTFLQTLPDLVTYATEGALFISAQLSTDAVSNSQRFGY